MLLGGVLLTALAYRPKELREDWWEWTERFYRSKNTRIVGPSLIVLSLFLTVAGLSYCLLKRHARLRRCEREEDSVEHRETHSQADRECLLLPQADIACFPDGSPRFPARPLLAELPAENSVQDTKAAFV